MRPGDGFLHTPRGGTAERPLVVRAPSWRDRPPGRRDTARAEHACPRVLETVSTNLESPELPTLVRASDPETMRAVVEAYLPQILRTPGALRGRERRAIAAFS